MKSYATDVLVPHFARASRWDLVVKSMERVGRTLREIVDPYRVLLLCSFIIERGIVSKFIFFN